MRPSGTAFKDVVLDRCCAALARNGFTRYRKTDVDWPLSQEFHCWVGLNTGVHSDHIEVSPFVGVHSPPLMKLTASLSGRPYNRSVATYAVHMGELPSARNEPAFILRPGQDTHFVDKEAQRLATLYATVGKDYAQSIASYASLLPLLSDRTDMLGGYPERVACCLYLMGDTDKARSFVIEFQSVEREYFEEFAAKFLRMLEE